MFKTALLSILLFFGVISTSYAQQSYFVMNMPLLCDETKNIINFIEKGNMVILVKGVVTMVNDRTVAVTIYANNERVLMIGHDPEGFSCFLGDIDTIVEWNVDLPKNIQKPKTPS